MEQQTLRFKSLPGSSSAVENLINELCAEYKVNEDFYGNLLVALTEAVNNAIYHGNKADASKEVVVTCDCDDKHIVFTVKDEGPGFDFTNLPDPTDPANLEKENGRGIFLMKHLSDSLEFLDNGRTVVMKFSL